MQGPLHGPPRACVSWGWAVGIVPVMSHPRPVGDAEGSIRGHRPPLPGSFCHPQLPGLVTVLTGLALAKTWAQFQGQVGRRAGPEGADCRYTSLQAKTSGKFSREELDRLWREFLHHKDKVQEYNLLLGTLGQTEGAAAAGAGGRAGQKVGGGLGQTEGAGLLGMRAAPAQAPTWVGVGR